MATTAAELMVKVAVDNASMSTGLAKAEAQVKGFTSRCGSAFGSMARVGGRAILALGAAGTAIVGTGLKVAADLEQTEIAFETMLGSGEKAAAFMEDLKDFAAKTPFEFPSLATAAKKLMAVGTQAEDVIPIMTTLGNATAAMGTGQEGIERATYALAQMQQKQKVTAEEMMQLTEAGVPAWEALAAVMGVDVPKAMEEVTKGAVRPELLFQAIQEGAGKTLGNLGGMMEKQSQTLKGLFSTLKDEVMMGLADSAKPLSEALKPVIPAFSSELGKLLAGMATAFGPVFATLVQLLADLMPVLAPLLATIGEALAGALAALGPAVGPVATAMADLAAALAPVLPLIAQAIAAGAQLAAAFVAALTPAIADLVADLLPPLVGLLNQAAPLFLSLVPLIGPVADILGLLASVIAPIAPELIILFGTMYAGKRAFTALKDGFKTVQDAMKAMNLTPWGVALMAIALIALYVIRHWDEVKAFFEMLGKKLAEIGSAIAAWWKRTVGGVGDWITEKWQAFLGWFTGLPSALGNLARQAGQFILDALLAVPRLLIAGIQAYVDFWLGLPALLVAAFKTVVNGIIGLWNNLDFGIHIQAPDWLGGWHFDIGDIFPDIPMLAKGGIVTRPTLAMVGEAGPEAIVPLSAAYGMGRRNEAINLAVNVRMDRKRFQRDADFASTVRGR